MQQEADLVNIRRPENIQAELLQEAKYTHKETQDLQAELTLKDLRDVQFILHNIKLLEL